MKDAANLHHFIIIPNYKEPFYKLQETIEAILKSDYPYKSIYLVLAFEKREEEAPEVAKKLTAQYGHFFKDVLSTYHVLEPHEAPGKASNQTHAARQISVYTREHAIESQHALITVCDADSILPPNYFSYLSYEYLHDEDRLFHFYWAPVLLYNNFRQLPFFVRMQATLSSILRLAFLSQTRRLIQVSTYSTSLDLLESVGYWDVDIIPEDWHIHLQAFYTHGPKVRTLPLYTIINGDAAYSGGAVKTFKTRYEQEKRWAWGVSDIGYAIRRSFTSTHIPFSARWGKVAYLTETHLLWPTSFFILTVSALVPPLVNPYFKRTVLGFLLPKVSSAILTVSTSFIALYLYYDFKIRSKLKQSTSAAGLPFMFIQWYLLPLVSFVLSSLPALDAHTRMIFKKKMVYKVTEKV
jgi:cellulose synthase/poly-beta-1,6-N-acetylglucosamine synthase-like glycosyltransferase